MDQITAMAHAFLHPVRQPVVKNPADYGLPFEVVEVTTEDGVHLSCWLIQSTGKGVIILGHPGAFSKYGYALEAEGHAKSGYDRDVEFLPLVRHLVDTGFSVLVFDQRNHGESGAGPNQGAHDPCNAYRDTLATIEYISNHNILKGQDIGLLSFCQSSLVSMIAMHEDPHFFEKSNVKALVAVQPISIEIFYRNFGLPVEAVEAVKQIWLAEGIDMEKHNPMRYAKDINVPVLFVQALHEAWSDIDHSKSIFEQIPTEKEAIWLEGERHRFDAYNYFNDTPEPLIQFFGRHLNR